MSDHPISSASLQELTALLLSTSNVEEALRRLADAAARATPEWPLAGVTLRRGEQVLTVASSDAHTLMIDEVQYSNGLDGGPCLEAMNTGQVVTVTDMAAERRWGAYPARMLAHGVRRIYSHPLRVDTEVLGALNMYATNATPVAAPGDPFGATARSAVSTIAEHTGLLLRTVIVAAQQVELTAQLRDALAHRAIIDQALGILMGQQRCTAETAFAMLRLASQGRNRKLYDIAADIVEAVSGQPPCPPSFNDQAS